MISRLFTSADWCNVPGDYVLHEAYHTRADLGHASGLRINDDMTSVYFDSALPGPVCLPAGLHKARIGDVRTLIIFKFECDHTGHGESSDAAVSGRKRSRKPQ